MWWGIKTVQTPRILMCPKFWNSWIHHWVHLAFRKMYRTLVTVWTLEPLFVFQNKKKMFLYHRCTIYWHVEKHKGAGFPGGPELTTFGRGTSRPQKSLAWQCFSENNILNLLFLDLHKAIELWIESIFFLIACRLSVHKLFTFSSSSPEPLGQFQPNSAQIILG